MVVKANNFKDNEKEWENAVIYPYDFEMFRIAYSSSITFLFLLINFFIETTLKSPFVVMISAKYVAQLLVELMKCLFSANLAIK